MLLSQPIKSVKNALAEALKHLPDFGKLSAFNQGKILDETFKSLLKDLMNQFGMRPGIDYVDNLKDNEPATDFVALTEKADQLITGLMEGKIIAVSGYARKRKDGSEYEVKAYYKRKSA
jgi:hypothetical protein